MNPLNKKIARTSIYQSDANSLSLLPGLGTGKCMSIGAGGVNINNNNINKQKKNRAWSNYHLVSKAKKIHFQNAKYKFRSTIIKEKRMEKKYTYIVWSKCRRHSKATKHSLGKWIHQIKLRITQIPTFVTLLAALLPTSTTSMKKDQSKLPKKITLLSIKRRAALTQPGQNEAGRGSCPSIRSLGYLLCLDNAAGDGHCAAGERRGEEDGRRGWQRGGVSGRHQHV